MVKYRLGDICEIVSGSTPKTGVSEYWDGDKKWITPAEITDESYIITDSVRKLTELGVAKTGLSSFPKGTVILSSRAPIGKVAIAGCEMYCNQGFKNLICSQKIYNRYLYWFLKGNTEYLNSLGRGATFKEISKQIVASIEINVPDMEQQMQAAENLERVSSIIRLRKQELQKLDDLIKARFVELFGDPIINSRGWQAMALENNATLLNGRAYKQDELLDRGKYPVLRVGNFFSNRGWFYSDLELEEDKYCNNGDLLYAWSASFGPQIWRGSKVIYHYHIWKVLVGKAYNKQFLCSLLEYTTKRLMHDTHGIAMMHLTKSGMEKTEFIVPPMELQEQFAAFVEQTDKSKVIEAINKANTLFNITLNGGNRYDIRANEF